MQKSRGPDGFLRLGSRQPVRHYTRQLLTWFSKGIAHAGSNESYDNVQSTQKELATLCQE